MRAAIAVFNGVTALDAIGPYEVIQRLPGAEVRFVGHRTGEVRTDTGNLGMVADATFDDPDWAGPDVVIIPGGIGTRVMLSDAPILDWIRQAHETTQYTTSVCTGSLVLAAAGLLDGVEATTHWRARDLLGRLGAIPVPDRVVERGKIVTAAGVSSGIDMALRLAELLTDRVTAQAMQLWIEYDPQPPFDAGSDTKAGPDVHDRIEAMIEMLMAQGQSPIASS